MPNAIRIISPYRFQGTWVFDDPAVDLVREPFVAGMPEMIDTLVAGIPDADRGFRLLFSDRVFPGSQWELHRDREEDEGWWYQSTNPPMRGWLCPALFKYFETAPERLYVRAEAIRS